MSVSGLVTTIRDDRRGVLALFDAAAWGLAVVLGSLARMDFEPRQVAWTGALWIWPIAILLHTVIAWSVRLHHGRATVATLEEMVWLGAVVVGTGTLLFLVNLIIQVVPRSVPLTALLGALAIMGKSVV